MPQTIDTLPTPPEACARILSLAEPIEPIEVSLVDALGMVMAESAVADVDLPPFDRASSDGYAVRASEARPGQLLRVAGLRWSSHSAEDVLESGEAIPVNTGDPLPVGADAVIPFDWVKPDPETGPVRVIQVEQAVEAGRQVVRRGHLLEAGAVLAEAGTRLEPSMVGLLASQGCVHPLCHRRVRVAVLAVGDHLVRPTEEPVMHRERNAVNAAIVALALQAGAMTHDLQAFPEARFESGLERATHAPIIIVLGPLNRTILRKYRSMGVEPVISGVALKPGGKTRYGVIRDDAGSITHHVFHLPHSAVAASTAFTLLIRPLITRLQGNETRILGSFKARWEGPFRATGSRYRAVPVRLSLDDEARLNARPVALNGNQDLLGFATTDALALLPAGLPALIGGELVDVTSLGSWQPR